MVEDSPEVLSRFEANLSLVDTIARQLLRDVGTDVLDFEEMRSYGQEGLLLAARRFDPDRGISFRRYASFRIRGAILDGMRTASHLPRRAYEKLKALRNAAAVAEGFLDENYGTSAGNVPASTVDSQLQERLAVMATAMAIGFEGDHALDDQSEVIRVSNDPSPEHLAESVELYRMLHEAIDKLPEREALLVKRHFFQEEKLDDICQDLGVSRSWASRLLSRAVTRLTKILNNEMVPTRSSFSPV